MPHFCTECHTHKTGQNRQSSCVWGPDTTSWTRSCISNSTVCYPPSSPLKMQKTTQHMYRQFHPPHASPSSPVKMQNRPRNTCTGSSIDPPSSPVKMQNRLHNTCTGSSIHLMPSPIFPSKDAEPTTQHIPQGCRNHQLLRKEIWLILAGAEILWEEDGFWFGFKRWQGWVMSMVLWEWIPNVGSKARERVKAMSLAFVLLDFQHVGVRRRA